MADKRKQPSLFSFFGAPKKKKDNNSAQSADVIAENQPDPQPGPSSSANSGCTAGHIAPSSDVTIGSEDDDGPVEVQGEVPVSDQVANEPMHTHRYDIGNYLGKIIDDHTKRLLLQSPWIPPPGYNFPYSEHNKKGKIEKRYINHSHLQSFSWVVFSESQKGLFCKYCFLFASAGGSNNQIPLSKLVKQPLKSFSKLLGKDGALITHENNRYHKEAIESAKCFLAAYENPAQSV